MNRIIVANWKMNVPSLSKALENAQAIWSEVERFPNIEVVIAAPFPFLQALQRITDTSKHQHLIAQNCHFRKLGPYTGEVSAAMIAQFAEGVLLGHSERRRLFGEDDDVVAKKARAALDAKLIPYIFVGEERKGEKIGEILAQANASLQGIHPRELSSVILVYEPLFAISPGEPVEPSYAAKVIRALKEEFRGIGAVLYGGSVSASNASGFFREREIDGAVVGNASLVAKEFIAICRTASKLGV